MTSTDGGDHTLGIGGKLQHVLADCNHETAKICVQHVLGDDLTATSHVSQEQLRKALGVSHINLSNVTGMELRTSNTSGGLAAVVVQSGDGSPLPITHRHCAHHGEGVVAAHIVAMPADVAETGVMPMKSLVTDKHNFVPHGERTPDEHKRNELNAAYYPQHGSTPSSAKLYQDCIHAKHSDEERVAIPLVDKITPDVGGLTAVASRCIKLQKKRPADLCAGASIVRMPHKVTGEDVDHIVADAKVVSGLADTVKSNTKVCGTFADGVKIVTHGLGDHAKPGDHVITQLTFHRSPTGDVGKVTMMKDLMPQEVHTGTVVGDASIGVTCEREQTWHDAMFAKKKSAAGATPQIAASVGGDAAADASHSAGPGEETD